MSRDVRTGWQDDPLRKLTALTAIFLCGLLWLERPGPIEASQMLGVSRFSLPPIGNVGLVTFSLLEMVRCMPVPLRKLDKLMPSHLRICTVAGFFSRESFVSRLKL